MLGRKRERAVLNRLLDEVRGGRGHVLVMPGEGGIGKTALLECAAEAVHEFRIAPTTDVQGDAPRMCGGCLARFG